MRYEINAEKSFELKIWFDNEAENPTIIQPHWPDGTAWASYEEAQGWGEATLASIADPTLRVIAGPSPEEPLQQIPEPPTTSEILQGLGVNLKELKLALDAIVE